MVTITKKEAKELGLQYSKICLFHKYNPDQEAIMNSCQDCKNIQDPCGCDEYMGCEKCDPLASKKST